MQSLKAALTCVLLAALIATAVSISLLGHTAAAVVAAVSAEIQTTRAALMAKTRATSGDLTGQIASARNDVAGRTERQVAALRGDVMAGPAD